MSDQRLVIRFPGAEMDQANKYARQLADELRDLGEQDIKKVDVARDNTEAQDFGATLVLVLGTTAVTAIAQGIKSWLARNNRAKIQILANGTVIAENLESRDASEIAKAISKKATAK